AFEGPRRRRAGAVLDRRADGHLAERRRGRRLHLGGPRDPPWPRGRGCPRDVGHLESHLGTPDPTAPADGSRLARRGGLGPGPPSLPNVRVLSSPYGASCVQLLISPSRLM